MSANPSIAEPVFARERAPEGRVVLHSVPWWMYIALRDSLDQRGAGVRMTYLDGELELMSPSRLHEDSKKILARLIEIWADETNVDLRGFGNATFRKEAKRGGLEPDECYKLGPLDDEGVPDIAIEVDVSTSHLDKLEIYARLGVPEVWALEASKESAPSEVEIIVHRASATGYTRATTSAILPTLDLVLLARFVRTGANQTELGRAYRSALRQG